MEKYTKNIVYKEDPLIYTIDNFFTQEECRHVINLARGNLKRATVSTAATGAITHGRTGSNYWIPHNRDKIMMDIALRISEVVKLPITHAEQFQVIHYGPTQEYSAHYDSYELEDDNEKSIRCLKMGGQRLWTALGYLNTPEEGGHTEFLKLNKKVDAVTGRLLVFQDYKEEINPRTGEIYYHMHLNTLHAGTPVLKGEKWGFNLWFRQKKLSEFFDLRTLFKNRIGPPTPKQYYDDSNIIEEGKPLKIGLPSNLNNNEMIVPMKVETEPLIVQYYHALNREQIVTILNHSKMKGFNESKKTFMINNNVDSIRPVIKHFEKILNVNYTFFENFQIEVYKNGNEPPERIWDLDVKRDRTIAGFRGQRMVTVLSVMNNNFMGGNIVFPKIGNNIPMVPGNVLIVKNNLNNYSEIDPRSRWNIGKIQKGYVVLLKFNIRERDFHGKVLELDLDKVNLKGELSYKSQLNRIYSNLSKTVEMKSQETLDFDNYKIDWMTRYSLLYNWKLWKELHGGYLFEKNLLSKDYNYSEMNPTIIKKGIFSNTILISIQKFFEYCILNEKFPFGDGQATRWRCYNESISRIIHYELLELIEHIVQKKLKPTYTYLSAYKGKTELPPHTDRDQCEYTVSFIFNKTPTDLYWPIFWDKKKQKDPFVNKPKYKPLKTNCLEFDTDIGGLIVFQGTDHIHYREYIEEGQRFYTLLLHYNEIK